MKQDVGHKSVEVLSLSRSILVSKAETLKGHLVCSTCGFCLFGDLLHKLCRPQLFHPWKT